MIVPELVLEKMWNEYVKTKTPNNNSKNKKWIQGYAKFIMDKFYALKESKEVNKAIIPFGNLTKEEQIKLLIHINDFALKELPSEKELKIILEVI